MTSNDLQTFSNVCADINRNEEANTNQQKKKWYAIAVGKTARSTGIYSSWAAAQVEVNRVSGACFARFNTYEEAKNFLYEHQLQKNHDAVDSEDDFQIND